MSTNLTVTCDQIDIMSLGDVLAKSGFFKDTKDASQAIVKVLAGQEMGLGPIASMTGIHIINGKPAPGATVMASVIKRSGRYDYRILEHTSAVCKIEFRERVDGKFEQIGVSEFTADDAKRVGTQNMQKFPKNMLFARALSNGAKWFCPDIFGGPVYDPGELGASVDYETGEIKVVDSPVVITQNEQPDRGQPEITLGEALAMRTPGGKELQRLDHEQLLTVSQSEQFPELARAAKIIIAESG